MNTYATLREKIAAEKDEREARFQAYAKAWDLAWDAGLKAGAATVPSVMVVQEMMPDVDLPRAIWRDEEGPCGFAWVTIRPGTCSFAQWARKYRGARKAYNGGIEVWISAFSQSYERKIACAQAMAAVLRQAIGTDRIYAGGRLD